MLRRGVVFALVLVLSLAIVSATSFSITDHSSTKKGIQISGADDLYAYEINFDYTGSNPSFSASSFFQASGTCSSDTDSSSVSSGDGIFTVYGSCLDNTQPGFSGSVEIGNITISSGGTLERRNAVFIDNQGNEETVSYISEDEGDSGGDSSSGSSGGSSGGLTLPSTITTILPSGVGIEVIPNDLSFLLAEGTYNTREITVRNIGSINVQLSMFIEGEVSEILSSKEGSFSLAPGEEKKVRLEIVAPETGLVTGKIYFLLGNAIAEEVPVVVNVISENFLFDASLSLSQLSYGLRDKVIAQLDLLQVGPALKVDVVATYEIKSYDSGEPLYEKTETFYVEGSATRQVEFDLSEINGIDPGKYLVGAVITYPGAYATSSSQFNVTGGLFGFEGFYVILFVFIVFAIITFVVIGQILKSRRNMFYTRSHDSKKKHKKRK